MIRRIVVPLDRSEHAERALAQAIPIARESAASMRLVHVWTPIVHDVGLAPTLPLDMGVEEDRRAVDEYLARTASDARAMGAPQVEVAVLAPPVAEAICADAQDSGADLVVMSTHGLTGWSRFWLGSVMDAVVRCATVPVLVVRAHSGEQSTRDDRPRRVLVPLDGTPEAESILEPAIEVLGAIAPTFHLLQIVEPARTIAPIPAGEAVVVPDPGATAVRISRARTYLDGIAARLRAQLPDAIVEVDVAIDERAASAVVAAAELSDVVAMATHGRKGATRLLLGSVADKVLRGSTAPILLLRRRNAPEESEHTVDERSAARAPA